MSTENKAIAVAQAYTDEKIASIPSVYHVKASVATVADLPASGNEAGDVRKVTATNTDYYWDGNSWELFVVGEKFTPELKAQIEANTSGLANKVDKVDGKGLSTNDFTNALKAKLDTAVEIISLTNGAETLAQLKMRLDEINAAGRHVFFDVAALTYPLYLCTIAITYQNDVPVAYRLNDLVSGSVSIGAYEASKTLNDILAEATPDLLTLTITCNTQDGVTVTGQTVTIRNGDSPSSPVHKTIAYNGQPVSLVVPMNFIYYISVSDTLASHFNPTTAQGVATTNTSVTLTYNDAAHLTSYADVKAAVNAGAGATIVGTEIADTYMDGNTSYSDPAIIVDVRTVLDADGNEHNAAIMQRKYATADDVQFDAPELELATGTYGDTLSYYVSDASVASTYRLLVKGTDYQVGDAISGTVYKNTVKDSTGYICKYGYNRYRDSAQRQWLNSDANIGAWWQSTHEGDTAPTKANVIKGYLAGCSAAMKQYAKPIRIQCFTNSVTDASAIDVMVDKVWLPSGTEMYGSANDNEGTYFPYWKTATGLNAPSNAANEGRICYHIKNHASAQLVRLRSAFRYYSYYAWIVSTTGGLYSYAANYSFTAAPAFAIY